MAYLDRASLAAVTGLQLHLHGPSSPPSSVRARSPHARRRHGRIAQGRRHPHRGHVHVHDDVDPPPNGAVSMTMRTAVAGRVHGATGTETGARRDSRDRQTPQAHPPIKGFDAAAAAAAAAAPTSARHVVATLVPLSLPLVLALHNIAAGCCSNVYTLEAVTRQFPHSGNLMTWLQFVAITLLSLPAQLVWPKNGGLPRWRPPTVPLPTSLLIVGLFWLTTVLNNLAMSFQVSVPLQIVFRCGNVLGSMVVGRLWMKRRYAPAHIGSVLVLTLGVVVFTIATQSTSSHQARDALAESTSEGESLVSFAIGVGLMLASLGVTAVLGTLQERTYQRYATPWTEALFSTHALALPLFWLLRHDIRAKWVEMHALAIRGQAGLAGAAVSRLPGRPMILDLLPPRHASPIPPLWIAMVVNVVTQYVCIAGVAQLNGMLASVHVNMILTVRKFASLVISLVLFHHPITPAHGWGGGLVVLGTLGVIFSQWQQFSYKQSLARATNLVVADPSP